MRQFISLSLCFLAYAHPDVSGQSSTNQFGQFQTATKYDSNEEERVADGLGEKVIDTETNRDDKHSSVIRPNPHGLRKSSPLDLNRRLLAVFTKETHPRSRGLDQGESIPKVTDVNKSKVDANPEPSDSKTTQLTDTQETTPDTISSPSLTDSPKVRPDPSKGDEPKSGPPPSPALVTSLPKPKDTVAPTLSPTATPSKVAKSTGTNAPTTKAKASVLPEQSKSSQAINVPSPAPKAVELENPSTATEQPSSSTGSTTKPNRVSDNDGDAFDANVVGNLLAFILMLGVCYGAFALYRHFGDKLDGMSGLPPDRGGIIGQGSFSKPQYQEVSTVDGADEGWDWDDERDEGLELGAVRQESQLDFARAKPKDPLSHRAQFSSSIPQGSPSPALNGQQLKRRGSPRDFLPLSSSDESSEPPIPMTIKKLGTPQTKLTKSITPIKKKAPPTAAQDDDIFSQLGFDSRPTIRKATAVGGTASRGRPVYLPTPPTRGEATATTTAATAAATKNLGVTALSVDDKDSFGDADNWDDDSDLDDLLDD